MCQLNSIGVYTVTVVFFVFIAMPVPINSMKYKVVFEPSRMFTPCKNTDYDHTYKYFDFSKLNLIVTSDNTLLMQGTISLRIDIPADDIVSFHITTKMKLRGRWVDTPYSHSVKDWCAVYYDEGMYWYDAIKNFVGEQRRFPPKKNLPLPINFTINLDLDSQTPLPTGEYLARTVFRYGKLSSCHEASVDLIHAPK